MAALCILLGLYPVSMAFGLIDNSGMNAPAWVVACAGLVFIIAGVMLFFRNHARINNFLASLICFFFAAVGLWVALFSPTEEISGGLPFLSQQTNTMIGRWVFAGGAMISLALAWYAARLAFKK